MEEFYTALALITTGVSLAMGTISLFIGVRKHSQPDLIFGIMGICLAIFFLIPPIGFILHDQPPYPASILIKRIFNYSYYALIPWFIASYTGFKYRQPIYFIVFVVVVGYVMMFLTTVDRPKPLWSIVSVGIFGVIMIYGFVAAIWQYKKEDKVRARWLLVSMIVYGILFLFTAINQFSIMEGVISMKLFYPMHFHSIAFMLIMGLRVVADVFEKYRLEKLLRISDKRWQMMMQNAPVFVMEVDREGNIEYINNYGITLMGYSTLGELKGHNWFDAAFLGNEVDRRKKLFVESVNNLQDVPHFVRTIQTKKRDTLTLTWTQFRTYTDDGIVNGMICVGINTTSEENANKLVNQLKLELEKEKIVFTNDNAGEQSLEIIGNSDVIRYAMEKARQVAKTNAPVLLEGETGVGKELIADLIHKNSSRNNAPIIKVNCGALPKELIEDELFGHEKGAFTSAIQSRKGRFELADGGTIFLDEIGELPLAMQPKLLRVLQNGEFERVGGQKTIKVDVRIIAATNRELQHEVQQGNFRDDLFYRLNVFPITIPPLRKRKEDLPLLINHFINLEAKKYNRQLEQISKADMQRLIEYSWPGNVRELKNVIERSVIASEGNTLKLSWILSEANESENTVAESTLEQIEKQHIVKIMEACHWRINGENGAAEKLDMHPNTLRSKMKKLGISRPVKDIS